MSVVLTHISECLLEDIVIADLELYVKCLSQRLAHFLITTNGGLPIFEAYANDSSDASSSQGSRSASRAQRPPAAFRASRVGRETADRDGNPLMDRGFEGLMVGTCRSRAMIHLLQYAVVYLT